MNSPLRIGLGIVLALALASANAGAQGPTVSFGAGMAHPLHADLDFTAPLLAGSVQIPIGRHMAIEPEVTRWTHTTRREQLGVTIQGPTGVIGHAGRVTTTDALTAWGLGVNVLARSAGRPVRAFGGGGIGVDWQDESYRVTLEDCEVPSQPSVCADQRIDRSRGELGVQAVGGLDVVISPRWTAFGAVRWDVRSLRDPGGASVVSVLGGVRVGIGP